MKRKNRGFTLIELLVVIAIIGVLVGLMASVLPKIHAQGRRITCTSNLRALLQAAHMFADDHGELIPDVPQLFAYLDDPNVFLCPEDTRSDAEFDPACKTSYSASEATPKSLLPSDTDGQFTNALVYIESDKLAKTFEERADVKIGFGGEDSDIAYRHGKSDNVTLIAFLDGHVKFYDVSDVPAVYERVPFKALGGSTREH